MITQMYSNFKTSGVGSSDKNGRIGQWTFLDTNSKVRTVLYYNTYKKLKKRYISDLGYQFNLIMSFDKNGKQIGKNGFGHFIEFDSAGNEAKKIYVSKNSVDSIYLFYSNILIEKIVINKKHFPGENTTERYFKNGQIEYLYKKVNDTTFQTNWYESGKIKATSKIYYYSNFMLGTEISYFETGRIKEKLNYDTLTRYNNLSSKYERIGIVTESVIEGSYK